MFCTAYPTMPRDSQVRAEEVSATDCPSNWPPPYRKEIRGRDSSISPAAMGRTKNSVPWREVRRASSSSPCRSPAAMRDSRGKITLVTDRMKVPAMTR